MRSYDWLFRPITINRTPIRNRIVLPPMNTNLARPDGSVSERFTNYYVERGKGGAGLLIVSSAYIDPAAKKRSGALLLHEDRFIPALRAFTDAVHATGARVLQQLNHNGRLLASSRELKTAARGDAVGPSAIAHLSSGASCRALTVQEIRELVEKFGQAARRAREAGFDGVELHGTHGYLINQFFSVYSNRRTDEYGGTLERRMRFPLEVYRRARELTGDDFLISYRVNARTHEPVETPFEEVIALCRRLEEEGVDCLHVTAGNSETPAAVLKMIPPSSTPQGCFVELAAAVKAEMSVPVIAVGRITTPELAEDILRRGKADLVATGRALIADPYWPVKAERGEQEGIRRCIGCNQGCMERLAEEKEVTCIYNPEVGREGEIRPVARHGKHVLVIGGGVAGMEAAVVAASRGHRVELLEKSASLGGQAVLAASAPGKAEFSAVADFLKHELERLGVAVQLNTEVTAATVDRIQPDAVIVAAGARPLVPGIAGVERECVVTAWDVLRGRPVGERIVVAGGGLVGTETALFLADRGKRVVLVEMLEDVGLDAGPLNRARLKEALRGTDIEVRCRTELVGISDAGAVVRHDERQEEIAADTVVLALGAVAQDSLRRDLAGGYRVQAVGDCLRPRKMLEAIHEAYEAAMSI